MFPAQNVPFGRAVKTPNWSIVGSILAATHDTYVKSQSTLYRKSWGFSGYSGFLPQGMLRDGLELGPNSFTVAVLHDHAGMNYKVGAIRKPSTRSG